MKNRNLYLKVINYWVFKKLIVNILTVEIILIKASDLQLFYASPRPPPLYQSKSNTNLQKPKITSAKTQYRAVPLKIETKCQGVAHFGTAGLKIKTKCQGVAYFGNRWLEN